MKVVLDTNILLVSISPKSSYHWIFQNFIDENIILCVTTEILQEYEEIIENHMGSEVANTVLQLLENSLNVEFVKNYFQWKLISVDPDDNKFVDCAISSNSKYIVTNDKHFNVLKEIDFPKIEVVSIYEFEKIIKK